MKASDVVDRARSLADLPNSQFVSHDDELNSLNESWKDLYQVLTEQGDDDYFVTIVNITVTAAMSIGDNEWEIQLPSDFYKLRFLDYRTSSRWDEVEKFPLSMRDYNPMQPYYRIRNDHLWVIGGTTLSTGMTLRLAYFPPPVAITEPDADLQYGTSYSAPNFMLVSAPGWAEYNQTAVYAYGGTFIIKAESLTLNTVAAPVSLFTESAAVTNLVYYKGILYWIRGGNIYSKTTDLTAAFLTPTAIVSSANVTSFAIANNYIYYTTNAAIRYCTLTGSGDALSMTVVATSACQTADGGVYYTDATGSLKKVGVTAAIIATAGITRVTTDGTVLYILDTSRQIRRVTVDILAVLVTDEVVRTDVGSMGNWSGGRIPITTFEGGEFFVIDPVVDYEFAYPNSVATEIMAHQCAVDWKVKQNGDISGLMLRLGHRSGPEGQGTGLWGRFERAASRDQYKTTRIRQSYDRGGNLR